MMLFLYFLLQIFCNGFKELIQFNQSECA